MSGVSPGEEEQPTKSLPPKAAYQRSHKRDYQQAAVQEPTAAVEDDFEEFFAAKKQGQKQVKLSTSKIDGVAHPRRPRIGPEFQAVVPEWPQHQPTQKPAGPSTGPMQQ